MAFPFDRPTWDEHRRRYVEAAHAAGRRPVCVLSRHVWVADGHEQALAEYAPMWLEEQRYYFRRGQLRHADFATEADFTPANAARNIVVGTPEQCAEQLVAYVREWGVDVLKLAFRVPLGPETGRVRENIERVGREVLPLVRDELNGSPEPPAWPVASLRPAAAGTAPILPRIAERE